MSKRKVKIYGLFDPRNQEFFYVGSSFNPSGRFSSHTSAVLAAAGVKRIVSELTEDGLKPELRILDEALPEERKQKEAYWMDWLRGHGHCLVNQRTVWISPDQDVVNMGAVIYRSQIEILNEKSRTLGIPRNVLIRTMLQFALDHMDFKTARLNFPEQEQPT